MANVSFYLFIKLSVEFRDLYRPVYLTSFRENYQKLK